jgi:hypothetical protein
LTRAVAVCLLVGLAATVRADDRQPARVCSNATLNGSYGFYRTGTTQAGPLAAIGILFFDGKGNSSVIQSISRNGQFEFDVTFPGLYEVAADCTGKGLTAGGDEIARLVVVDNGKSFYIFSESPGNAIYGVGTKIHTDR